MTATQKIKQLATRDGALPYVFGSMAQLNSLLDAMYRATTYPVCLHVQTVRGTLSTYPGTVDAQEVIIGYADKIALDYDPEGAQAKVDALKDQGAALFSRIAADGFFEPVTEAEYSVVFDTMDANLVAVLFTFKLEETAGRCL